MLIEANENDCAKGMPMMATGQQAGAMRGHPAGLPGRYRLAGNPTHAVIIGLGHSGLSCARFLAENGLDVDVYDTQQAPQLAGQLAEQVPAARLHAGTLEVKNWQPDSLLVVSPGVPLSHPELLPLLEQGLRPVGDVELFAQCVMAPVIAITGSNGKSTVTALTGEILKAAGRDVRVGGNIGVPVLDLLDDTADCYVLELSSFQLETTWNLAPQCATVLNLAADHMDRYQGMADYIAAKEKIYHGTGAMLINTDDATCRQLVRPGRETLYFGQAEPASEQEYGLRHAAGSTWLARGDTLLADIADLRLAGRHNQMNALAAWALARCAGVDDSVIREAVAAFRGLPHRMEWLGTYAGLDWINDSKGTNVGATVAAIQGLAGPLVLIAGGQGKGADFTPLAEAFADKVRAVILIGADARLIGRAVAGHTAVEYADGMQEAVRRAAALAPAGATVLLSPACASFDMYSGFAARGDDFRRCVEGLA